MSNYKYADWVVDGYLEWAKNKQKSIDDSPTIKALPQLGFHSYPIHAFLTRDDSKTKLKTLRLISELNKKQAEYGDNEIDIAFNLCSLVEDPYVNKYGAARTKEVTSALALFRKATNKLFNSIEDIHNNRSVDLIEGVPDALFHSQKLKRIQDERLNKLIASLEAFDKKSTKQVFLDFADNIESLGTGNPYYLVSGKEPTKAQNKIRTLIYHLMYMVGPETIKDIRGLAPLITHIVDITSPDDDELCPRDVDRQIQTTIRKYEELNMGGDVKKLTSTP